jgi:hypothetical protein
MGRELLFAEIVTAVFIRVSHRGIVTVMTLGQFTDLLPSVL